MNDYTIDVDHVALLARIKLSDEERKEFERLIVKAKRLIDKLLEADVENVEPLYHPLEEEGLLRRDEPSKPTLDRERALGNAAKVENGFIVAPRTVEE